MDKLETVLRDLLFCNLEETTTSDDDYAISVASFLALNGEWNKALEIFNGLTDLDEHDAVFVDYQKGHCYYYLGDKDKAKDFFDRSYCGGSNPMAGYRLGRLYLEGGETSDYVKGISQIRRAAFMLNMDAMREMTRICHDNIYDGVRSQDRKQELFWSKCILAVIRLLNGFVRNHAYNMAEGKYDQHFSKEAIDDIFALAKALKGE